MCTANCNLRQTRDRDDRLPETHTSSRDDDLQLISLVYKTTTGGCRILTRSRHSMRSRAGVLGAIKITGGAKSHQGTVSGEAFLNPALLPFKVARSDLT
ncbi:hypothetical protein RSOLAG1IB_11236 [Rhizoctonia solani AG-1 IB]|uniref:Uncharacterized protein n=1 Tax=Thanatephorus cucumeris (strain AG1-IB / isolate 7/3/14) TaxID=1108050 RepID=A0A0B7F8B1_THACB|nr:hypothetical protein RSOLAG1IB_11236 [Rhizoctonia solani AG-1 IB]